MGGGEIVECPRHGWRYDLRSGACLTDPSQPLRKLAVRVESGRVWVRTAPLPGADEGDDDGGPQLIDKSTIHR